MLSYGWQINPEAWAQIPADIAGSDAWRFVAFNEIEAGGIPISISGIYFICASPVGRNPTSASSNNDLFSKLFTPIYIGKTDNLRRRFTEHCKRPSDKVAAAKRCFGSCLQFWFHRLPAQRIGVEEARLIKCFGPVANDREEKIKVRIGDAISVGIQN